MLAVTFGSLQPKTSATEAHKPLIGGSQFQR